MKTLRLTSFLFLVLIYLFFSAFSFDNILFAQPIANGDAVATCYSGTNPNGHVVGILKIQDFQNAPINSNWSSVSTSPLVMSHGPTGAEWTSLRLGEVFGIALDDVGSIYVAATSIYRLNPKVWGTNGVPSIYKIDGTSGVITSFNNTLPNSVDGNLGFKPAFGNICFDKDNKQFFISNFEDGKIYRLDNNGVDIDNFDYGVADNDSAGFAPIGERVWGVGYNAIEKRLYYAVWSQDWDNRSRTVFNTIRSIVIKPDGTFDKSSDQHEFNMPDYMNQFFSMPVADIAFSQDGQTMLLAERSMLGNSVISIAHYSRLLEYTGSTGSWSASPVDKFIVGTYNNTVRNSSGGVDFGYNDREVSKCDSMVWATGDALQYGPEFIYGLQGVSSTGGKIESSHLIDLDEEVTGIDEDKYDIGDVEVFKKCKNNSCDNVQSSITPQDNCCFSLTLENNTVPTYIGEVQIEAVSNVDISVTNPAPSWMINPYSNQLVGLSTLGIIPLPSGVHQNVVDVCLSNYNSIPQTVKIKWLAYDTTVCEEFFELGCLPPLQEPKCANVVKDSIYCDESGQIFYQFDIQNNTHLGNPFTIGQIQVNLATPDPSLNTVTPTVFPVPNLQPGNATTGGFFNLQLSGPGVIGGAPFCFTITVHDTADDPLYCCTETIEHCALIPVCDDCCDDFVKEVLNSEIECDLSAAPNVTFIPPVFSRTPTWVEWDFECDGTIDFRDDPYTGANPMNNYGATGNYVACLTAYRIHGEDTCCVKQTKYVEVGVEVNCCDEPNFSNEVWAGFSTTGGGNVLSFTPNGNLGDCAHVEWIWGDGSPNGASINNNAISHTFISLGKYSVCMIVRRIKPDGTECEEVFEDCQEVDISIIDTEPNSSCCGNVIDFNVRVEAGFSVEVTPVLTIFAPLQLEECDSVLWSISSATHSFTLASQGSESIAMRGLPAGEVQVSMLVTGGGECLQEYVDVVILGGEACACSTLPE